MPNQEAPKKGERMDLEEIQKVLEMMKENDLSEFELEDDGFRLAAKRGAGGGGQSVHLPQPDPSASRSLPVLALPVSEPALPPADSHLSDITSPMVGTFYRSSAPEAAPFVSNGQEVEADTVVCVIEAMKVMNEIKAETRGIIRKICIENATAVQFGSVLFKVESTD